MPETYCTAFTKLCELEVARGVRNMNQTPGLHSCTIDEEWRAEINPHDDPIGNVPPFHAMIYWQDTPVGLINHCHGIMFVGAEDDLIAALERAIATEAAHA